MPKIVDDETFARVQSILASRKRHGRRTGKRTYLLTGMVFCGLCGHRYCGDAMQTGGEKNRSIIGTYFCNNRKNHGAHACGNQNIHQQPLEELVLRKIEEIVFDESRIPGIVQAYQQLNQQESGEEGEKIRTLRQNLKTVEQKIANIVNVITNTGSAALVNQLNQLEKEKEQLDFQIQVESRDRREKELNENAIREAFRQAQKMFHSRTSADFGCVGQFPDESALGSQLEEGVEQTNLRKLPLCQLIVKNPIDGIWLVRKDVQ